MLARQIATLSDTTETRRLYDMPTAARCLGITRRSLERLIARRLLHPVRIPGLRRTLIDPRDLDALVAQVKAS